MITSEDIKKELVATSKVVEEKGTIVEKAIYKLLTVVLKVVVNTRTNTSLIMTALKIKPIEPKKKESGELDKV